MDAQPLMVVKPEDLAEAVWWVAGMFTLLAVSAGAFGYMLAEVVAALLRAIRVHRARAPFAVRQAAAFKRAESIANVMNRRMHRLDQRQFEARRRAAIVDRDAL